MPSLSTIHIKHLRAPESNGGETGKRATLFSPGSIRKFDLTTQSGHDHTDSGSPATWQLVRNLASPHIAY